MEQIICKNGEFTIPKEYREWKKGFVCTQHRVKTMYRGRNITTWFRHKPEKPYLPLDIIEFKQIGGISKKYECKSNPPQQKKE